MVVKLLEYAYCIIGVMLCNWYVPKIQFKWACLLLPDRQIILHSLLCNQLLVMLGFKLGVKTDLLVSLKCMDRSVLAHFLFSHPARPHLISTVGTFWCTIAIMQEKHRNILL